MTGFGTSTVASGGWSVRWELRTVNHKGLDVKLRLPRVASHLEIASMALLRGRLERGRVDAQVEVVPPAATRPVVLDTVQARALVDEALQYARQDPRIAPQLDLGQLLRLPGVVTVPEGQAPPATFDEDVRLGLEDAVLELLSSREREGVALMAELERRLLASRMIVDGIAARTLGAPERLAERLRSRLAELATTVEPSRLAQELVLVAERVDVTEELARLRIHLDHFLHVMTAAEPVGRKLDFLCQELLREANTTASKCQDAPTAHAVVELKAEIERIREQVQNVE